MKKSFRVMLVSLAGLFTLLLGSCAPAPGIPNDPSTQDGNATVSLADLVGTWKAVYPKFTGLTVYTGTPEATTSSTTVYDVHFTLTVLENGNFGQETVMVPTAGSATTANLYADYKGTVTIDGDLITETIATARTSGAPFTDDSGWAAFSASQSGSACIYGKKLYLFLIGKAQGTPSGIVGTWILETAIWRGTTTEHIKEIYTFTSDKTVKIEIYRSTSATYPSTPEGTVAGSYDGDDTGIMTIAAGTEETSEPTQPAVSGETATQAAATDETTTQTVYYRRHGSYLLFSDTPDMATYAFTKQ